MNKRTLFLLGCLSLLLLTAGRGIAVFPPPEDQSSRSSTTAEEAPDKDHARFELLSAVYGSPHPAEADPAAVPDSIDNSTLWLARAIYSETKLPHEQELVAWVVRNRVETEYRGSTTYKEVVLDPYQFSAFNPDSPKRSLYTSLKPTTKISSWQTALWIAHFVRHADPAYRPFSVETRHFFSERSMKGRRMPVWANQQQNVSPGENYQVNERRFRFYKEIS